MAYFHWYGSVKVLWCRWITKCRCFAFPTKEKLQTCMVRWPLESREDMKQFTAGTAELFRTPEEKVVYSFVCMPEVLTQDECGRWLKMTSGKTVCIFNDICNTRLDKNSEPWLLYSTAKGAENKSYAIGTKVSILLGLITGFYMYFSSSLMNNRIAFA